MNNTHCCRNSFVSTALLSIVFLTGCTSQPPPQNRAPRSDTIASVTHVEHMEGGKYAYMLSFPAPDSIALDTEGKPVTRVEATRHALKPPLLNQTLRIRYLREEPTDFTLLDPLQFDTAAPHSP